MAGTNVNLAEMFKTSKFPVSYACVITQTQALSRGDETCEICGSTARNVAGVTEAELVEQWSETNDTAMATSAAAPVQTAESRNFWQGHRFLNFLLACMVFAFVISWLFHFNVPS
ncbi:unnamed protein product [Prunus armeniaca]|uniref:Uncharacterized protein n=1 Tax=Prunus armeniaca TaxID=36596 RepID=A0A6J5U4H8_PRUAR|nr:unnamed protein product [Prunus armeniaca]CAB4301302.1 unnamed protein product [Prunus armeniaca]